MTPKILPLNPAEHQWIAAHLRLAHTLIRTFAPQHGAEITLPALDDAYTAWLAQHDPQEDPNPFINAFGVAFGQQFVEQHGFTWVVAQEQGSAEMAIHHTALGAITDVLIYPPNFVAKRYINRTTHFFQTTFQAMQQEWKTPPAPPTKKPWWKR